MAANLRSRGLASLFGKRLLGQIRSRDSAAFAPRSVRSVHDSVYEKNQDDHVEAISVPDHVIPPQPVEYWAPHPKTGVFGPASDDKRGSGVGGGADDEGSVLQQTAFFRSIEDLDKPPVELHSEGSQP